MNNSIDRYGYMLIAFFVIMLLLKIFGVLDMGIPK